MWTTEDTHAAQDGYCTPSTLYESMPPQEIAVVGVACRLPGNNNTPEQFWESIMNQQVASGNIPDFRWETYRRRDPRNKALLEKVTSKGYFVNKIEDFDSSFFGISPKEAVLMDPQQRVSLEVAWEALENAGIPPQSLAGSNTACFMGVNSDDYSKLLLEDLPGIEAWMGIGTAYCGIPNRISYLLDLRGPSTAVDAACASSLVAIHHGRQALLMRETDIAIVGGVNAICGPGMNRVLDEAGAISKDGVSRSFDDAANGYGRGEGATIIILKRYHDAVENNDNILAILKGSAVGQDGKTNGIMAPNAEAQKAVARTALGNIEPSSVQYIEAHATSTSVGDPVEIMAMADVYGQGRSVSHRCLIGSVKPNVGHLEAGAGAVGFLKAVLAIQRRIVPPQANITTLNRKIEWEHTGLSVPTTPVLWPKICGPRRAAICSYGYGGTISHAVIEECPPSMIKLPKRKNYAQTILLLSAPQRNRFSSIAQQLCTWIETNASDLDLESIATTLATRRGHHEWRMVVPASNLGDAVKALQSIAQTAECDNVSMSRRGKNEDIVWIFSGHGAQWPKMGQDLLATEPDFRACVEEIDHIIQREAGLSALELLEDGGDHTSDVVQVLTYVVQIGLTRVLRSKGVQPKAIIGHSVGEIAAAVAAGCLTTQEGAIVVCRRAVLYRTVRGEGAMAMIDLPCRQATLMLKGRRDIWAAIDSSPTSCVVSGSPAAVSEFSILCTEQHLEVMPVNTDIAFHTPLLDGLAKAMLTALSEISGRKPQVRLYTTAMTDPREPALRDGAYWVRNMLSPVLLTPAVRAAVEDGYRLFQEVSSHPVVSHSVNETIMDMDVEDFVVVPTLVRRQPSTLCILKSIGSLWSQGAGIDWKRHFSGIPWAIGLPNTPWEHRSYWKSVGATVLQSQKLHDPKSHTLLGQRIRLAAQDSTVFTTQLSAQNRPFPGSHPLHGTEIVPAAVLLNTFFDATRQPVLTDVHLRVPVALNTPRDVQVQVEGSLIRISSRLAQDTEESEFSNNDSWLTHTTAKAAEQCLPADATRPHHFDIATIRSRIGNKLSSNFSTEYLANVGVPEMGFPWVVTQLLGTENEMLAQVDVSPTSSNDGPFPWHQTSWAPIFDAATSIGSTLFHGVPRLRMPARISAAAITPGIAPPRIAYIHVVRTNSTARELGANITILNEDGNVLARFENMQFSEIEGDPGLQLGSQGLLHRVAWLPATMPEAPMTPTKVCFVGGVRSFTAQQYMRQLSHRGIAVRYQVIEDLLDQPDNATSDGYEALVYLPAATENHEDIFNTSKRSCLDVISLVKHLVQNRSGRRLYVITQGALDGAGCTGLSQAPLVGLSRIVASEHPEVWGALIDAEAEYFPLQAMQYVSGADVIKIEDSIPKVARLRPLHAVNGTGRETLVPRPEATYLITGGLGSLGLELTNHLVESGARRIVLVSRSVLPPRKYWANDEHLGSVVIQNILNLERRGAVVYPVSVDLSQPDGAVLLSEKLEGLQLPPVAGVVHAAGVLEDELVLSTTTEAFSRVVAPKVVGGIHLHQLFPVGQLDFFVLFSSCGQLFGFPGQASYATGNSFLDSLAQHRRYFGDNAIAFQWTSWRGVSGMGDNPFVEAELENRGITSVTSDEAFRAWKMVGGLEKSQCVVTRVRKLGVGEDLPHLILNGAVGRDLDESSGSMDTTHGSPSMTSANTELPKSENDRMAFLVQKISEDVAAVLQLADPEDVDPKAALSDLGMDSVMTVALRKFLQRRLEIKIPPTLIWGHPTVSHLAKWYCEQLRDQ